MMSEKILNISILTILLSTVAVGAGQNDCVGGVCFVNLDKNKPLKVIEQTKEIKYIDKSMTIILDGEEVSVFPKSTYLMNENEEVDSDSLIVIESLEDKILEKTTLPYSEHYCENNKIPLFNRYVDIYECV